MDLGSHPFIVLSDGAEVRIMKVRIEANVKGYPREKELLWFFTSPNLTYLTPEKSNYESKIDFWGEIEWLVSTKLDILLSRNIAKETLSLFRTYLENLKREYQKLISRQDLDEPMLQQYLENHFFLLSPRFISKKKKRNLGPYTPDFILGCGGKKTLIEIQLNRDPIIKNGKPSEGFEEALKQLSDWLNWIESNEPAALPRFKGLIVIGRKENYLKHEKIIKNILSSNAKYSVNLLTYDDLVDSIDYVLLRLSGNN